MGGLDCMEDKITAFSMVPVASGLAAGGKNRTLRLVIPINLAAKGFTVRFSNRESKKPGLIDSASLCRCNADGMQIAECIPLTVRGKPSIRLMPGEVISTDPVEMTLTPGTFLALSLYCATRPTSSNSLGKHAFLSKEKGNYCLEAFNPQKAPPLLSKLFKQQIDTGIPFFRALDLFTDETPVVVSCFGDSITMQCNWYTPLLEKLYRLHPGKVCLLNSGISGNRLLKGTPANVNLPGAHNIFGEAGIKRIEWDSLADHGVTHVMFALGINDLIHAKSKNDSEPPPSVEIFIAACRDIVAKAHAKKIKVIGMSIYPSLLHDPDKEEKRLEYNQAMSKDVFDYFWNIEEILKREGADGYKAGYAQADGQHLSIEGGKALIDSLDEGKLAQMLGL